MVEVIIWLVYHKLLIILQLQLCCCCKYAIFVGGRFLAGVAGVVGLRHCQKQAVSKSWF